MINAVVMQGYEVWNDINYKDIMPNYYMISNYGRVYSKIKNTILVQSINNSGYHTVTLRCTKRKYGTFTVHRLLMISFNPVIGYADLTVNHHDCNKLNNDLFNLEWMTSKENNEYKYMTNTDNTTGEDNVSARITNEQATIICQELEKGTNYTEILHKIGYYPKDFNDTMYDLITNIKRGISWKFISRNYDISSHIYNHSIFTDDEVRKICSYLEQGKSIGEIYSLLYNKEYYGSKKHKSFYEAVRGIKNRKSFNRISENYNF